MVYPADVAAVSGFLCGRHRAGNGVRSHHHADPQLAGDHAAQHGADVSRLYAFMHRNAALKTVMQDWMKMGQTTLEQWFGPVTTRALDVY